MTHQGEHRPIWRRWWFIAEACMLMVLAVCGALIYWQNQIVPGTDVFVWWLYNLLFIVVVLIAALQAMIVACAPFIVMYWIWKKARKMPALSQDHILVEKPAIRSCTTRARRFLGS